MDCDVVLIPEKRIAEQAVAASRQLSRLGSSFVLEDGKVFPHVSLYILRFKPADLPNVEASLRRIAHSAKAVPAQATDYTFSHKYAVVDYRMTPAMVELQNAAVAALNPLRDGMPLSEQENMREATDPHVIANFETYGYKYVGNFFRPHVTLTRFENEHQLEDYALPPVTNFDGEFVGIGLFQLGPHSTCVRKIAEFPFTAH